MQIYYPSLQAIEQRTMQLDTARCPHCGRSHQLVSHGFIRKKQARAERQAVGKRVLCSNRYHRTGCGRTMQLYLDTTVRYLHRAGSAVVAFVLSLMAGMSIQAAYRDATGTATLRLPADAKPLISPSMAAQQLSSLDVSGRRGYGCLLFSV